MPAEKKQGAVGRNEVKETRHAELISRGMLLGRSGAQLPAQQHPAGPIWVVGLGEHDPAMLRHELWKKNHMQIEDKPSKQS